VGVITSFIRHKTTPYIITNANTPINIDCKTMW